MMPSRFSVAGGDVTANGVIFSLDTDAKRVTQVDRISF